jgi:unconventional prefoldin RPB5 interactor 1
MVLPVKDSFADLERHRLRLEGNVSKLKKALKHWQTWEAEYEGLKEEILAFHGDPRPEDLVCSSAAFDI